MKSRRPAFLLLTALFAAPPSWAETGGTLEVYKSPYCGCCGKWVDHMRANGFKVSVHEIENVPAKRQQLGMPDALGSCHSARIGNYVIEGHVPAADIKRLLKEKPKALGLAVPGMPAGSPGMDIPNSPPYSTLLVRSDGSTRNFATH